MSRYLVRRVLLAIPTLLVISFVLFAILSLAPGDPLAQFAANPAVPPEVRENIRRSLGLDDPWPIRYVKWLVALAHGDWGFSFGIISALKQYSLFDHIATTFAFIGFSVPTFFTGLLLIIFLSVKLNWLPFIYDSTLQVRDLASLGQQVRQSIMPILVLGLFQTATLVRYTRASMLENLPQDYVRTARAKGLAETSVVTRHVVRNSLIPVVTLIALSAPAVFSGAIITEQIFRVPGIGSLLITSIQNNDIPVIMAITFTFSFLVVIFNMVADVLYGVLDPRIRYD
jgi:peptide/nickel transport system permease protein